MICKFCGKTCKPLGLSSHQRFCSLNPNKQKSPVVAFAEKNGSWRKGLDKYSDERIRRNAQALSLSMKKAYSTGKRIPSAQTDKAKSELSERQSVRNRGGKSKWFEVSGIKVQGTWEYNIALKLNELGIHWIKPKTNKDLFKYKQNEKIRSYAPDFYLPEYNVYLEVKGYWWGNDREKMDAVTSQYPHTKFIIVEKKDYLECLAIDA